MSTIKSSDEHLTLNADGSGNDIKFQSNGTEVASISDGGVVTATTFTIGSVGNATSSGSDLKISGTDDIFFNVAGASNNILQLYGGSSANDQSKFDSHVYPLTDNSKDLGNASERWKDLYLSGGLKVGGTGTVNTLDDYEEGNWTPTLTGSGTISHRVGKYVKIGNQIMIQGEIRSTSYNNSGATDVQIGGLPYSSYNESNYNFAANITPISGFNLASDHGIVGYMSPNQSHINLFGLNQGAGANYDFLQQGEMGTTVEVFFAVHYRTN